MFWGNSAIGDYRIVYSSGSLAIEKGGSGAGILVVKGDLTIKKNFTWHGLVVALGEVEFEPGTSTTRILGGFVKGNGQTELEDSVSIVYSTQTLTAVAESLPHGNKYHLATWREAKR